MDYFSVVGSMLGVINISIPGPMRRRVRERLAALRPGSPHRLVPVGESVEAHDEQGSCVARLSKSGRDKWREKLAAIERVTVLAMVQRTVEDSGEEYRERCRTNQWEIPVAEVCYLEG